MKVKCLTCATLLLVLCLSCQQKPEQPNIIFIMTDDHAYQAISAYGSYRNETPNIDRLANEGMLFSNAFVTNSICAPSRAVILTGKYSHINGVLDNVLAFDSTQQTFPKVLKGAGYQTALIGKWHLKSQPTGFDYWKVLPGQGHYYNPEFLTPEGKVQVQGYVTDIITDIALDWLKNIRDKDRPFLMMCQHKAPHREWLPGPANLKKYQGEIFPEPPTLFDDYSNRGSAAREQEMTIRDHMNLWGDMKIKPPETDVIRPDSPWAMNAYKWNYDRMTDEQKKAWDEVYDPVIENFQNTNPQADDLLRWKYQRYMNDYLATIASVDDNLGRLLDYLDESGLSENTMVVYTSDQGFYMGEHGWFDKRFMYEESLRTPLIIRWPGKISPGTVCEEMVLNLDYSETFLDAAGIETPPDMQGESILPLLKGRTPADWRDAIYYHYYEYPAVHAVKRHYGIRTQRYKLIHFYYDVDEWELYDLQEDPLEMNNLYGRPGTEEITVELSEQLQQLRARYRDSDELTRSFLPVQQ